MKENPQLNSYLRSATWNKNEASKIMLSDIRKKLRSIKGMTINFSEITKDIFNLGIFFNCRVEDYMPDYNSFQAKLVILAGLKLCPTANGKHYDIITLWLDKEGNSYEKNLEYLYNTRTLEDIYRFLQRLFDEDWKEDIGLDKTSSGLEFYLKKRNY